ncbi:SAM-dependent methyltransferase [Mucilaginibacter paludis]|uniref:Phytanoyl-CoA dioxygenase (PhyH) family n=1 Tax=Mucilaginibacter paludis DSM 18603 TaxID=714943 RepID=H1Y8A7_9SPHI|nr:phytanoyl-CoA dioxygenase (PhyH) family [Mucilaginibacter paludis]EHQ24926.1 phytanoyl-CoA dioxygenase (PhyH) family [Mucilaginibacter paludis DSM 18603]
MKSIENIDSAIQTLLFSENYKDLYEAVHLLHNQYSAITRIYANSITDQDIFLESGKAISPQKAAHCLLDIERTRKFIKGIYQAILQLQHHYPSTRINILYAGTGPYATLVTPLTSLFTAEQISLFMLDINEVSLNAVSKLYKEFEIDYYVQKYIHADASTYLLDPEDHIHLIITETMQNALRKEPQVAIMNNLIPQLPDKGIFIPQEISVNAMLLNMAQEQASFLEGGQKSQRKLIGNIYTVGQYVNQNHPVTLPVPSVESHKTLALLTDITVYGDHKLDAYQSGLTLPYHLALLDDTTTAVSFEYILNSNPHFKFQLFS